MRPASRIRCAVIAGSAVLTGSLLGSPADAITTTAASAATLARPAAQVDVPVPEIDWRRCKGWTDEYECASVSVPLDYDKPDGETIRLRILRDPADRPKQRIGSLFVNPGGPGGSSADFAAVAGDDLGKDVRRRFDIVGVDPRGVGGTTNAVCKGTWHDRPTYPLVAFPFTHAHESRWLRVDAAERRFCARNHNAMFDHMTTADVARDMDLIRQALGDEQLTYYGVSYGSYLGETYAAMFPDRVRALAIDGVLDPVAWSTGRRDTGERLGFSTRLRSGEGAYDALVSGLAECDRVGQRRCPASGDVYGEWRTIIRKARNGELAIDGARIRYTDIVSQSLGSLYSRSSYRHLTGYVHSLYRESTAKPHGRVAERWEARAARQRDRLQRIWRDRTRRGLYAAGPATAMPRSVVNNPFTGVACADSVNPRNPRAWVRASRRDDYTMPWFGRLWTWSSSICARWPGSSADAYRGPWKTNTSTPLLVIGNSHDPATPISGARAANRLFDGSRLLMMDGWGHGALGQSECVTERLSAYLLRQELPASGTVCRPDHALYPVRKG